MSPIKRRREKKRILIVTPEITYLPSDMGNMANYSSAKAGGLADVSGSLPIALHALKRGKNRLLDVRLVLPAYPDAVRAAGKLKKVADLHTTGAIGRVSILEGKLPGSDVTLWLVDAPGYFKIKFHNHQGVLYFHNMEAIKKLYRAKPSF